MLNCLTLAQPNPTIPASPPPTQPPAHIFLLYHPYQLQPLLAYYTNPITPTTIFNRHGIGLVGAMIGTPILLLAAFHHGNIPFLIGTIIFITTMLLVYLVSTLYHCWPRTHTKSLLQIFDHLAIFLLIAGTYTPFALGPLRGVWGLTMLGIVWALALFGALFKVTHGPDRHRKFAMTLYLGMGWLAACFPSPSRVSSSVSSGALACRWWDRLHRRRFIFHERAFALRSFCLALVRPYGHELSLCRGPGLCGLTTRSQIG